MGTDDVADFEREIGAEPGVELGTVQPFVVARMRLLARLSHTFADCRRLAGMAREVFRYYERAKPAEAFSDAERRTVVLASVFSDIGKTGPLRADGDAQELIVEMFAVEGVRNDAMPVAEFLRTYFPSDADAREHRFSALGLDPAMTIRQFWNLHSAWTLEIAEAGGVPPEVVAAAATHHLLDDVNPESVVGPDQLFTRPFGDNTAFDRAEKLVIVLDKYDAVRRRGRLPHAGAIEWLRNKIASHPHYRDDTDLVTLVSDVEHALRDWQSD